jgi:hypothetical protein
MTAAAAVIRNPWTGRGFVDDLRPEIMAVAPEPGPRLVAAVLDACGGADGVEACGKAAVVGTGGEIEHASPLIHTLRFGNLYARRWEESPTSASPTSAAGPAARSRFR